MASHKNTTISPRYEDTYELISNWEWMIHCAQDQSAELVIVTRDLDYGLDVDDKPYTNDFLRHEFRERVSHKRDVILCRKLSEALKHFEVAVSEAEVKAESALIVPEGPSPTTFANLMGESEGLLGSEFARTMAALTERIEQLKQSMAKFPITIELTEDDEEDTPP